MNGYDMEDPRLKRGNGGGIGCVSIAFTIASGIYLFNVEKKSPCNIIDSDLNVIDVAHQFELVLILLFASHTAGIGGAFLVALCGGCLQWIASLAGCVNLAAFIMLIVYRFKEAGRFCSGDKLDYDPAYLATNLLSFGNLVERGKFLLGYMITVCVLCGLACLLICCVACVMGGKRRY